MYKFLIIKFKNKNKKILFFFKKNYIYINVPLIIF